MSNYDWITQLSAASALIVAFFFLLRYLVGQLNTTLKCLQRQLENMEKTMLNRDQIILNHLEHFQETQEKIAMIMDKICKAWEINGKS